MKKLYSFEKLHQFLDDRNYPKVSTDGFQVIKTDFSKAFREGKISFEEDGIYLEYQGKKWRGYMFMGEQIGKNAFRGNYSVEKYDDYPRFHLKKCSVIANFIDKGIFHHFYIWANDRYTDVIDRDTEELHTDVVLKLCSRCKNLMKDDIENTTLEFYESLDKESIFKEEIVQTDIFGYTLYWQSISNAYKRKQNYTCEQCGIQVEKKDRRFIHTHHKNGDKLNNSESNLECLCILCHSQVDKNHTEKTNPRDLEIFLERYKVFI